MNKKIEGGIIIKGEAYIRVDVGSRHMNNDGTGKMVHLAVLNIVDDPHGDDKRALMTTQQIELPAHEWPKVLELIENEVATITNSEPNYILQRRTGMLRLVNCMIQMQHENPRVMFDEETLRGMMASILDDMKKAGVSCR